MQKSICCVQWVRGIGVGVCFYVEREREKGKRAMSLAQVYILQVFFLLIDLLE